MLAHRLRRLNVVKNIDDGHVLLAVAVGMLLSRCCGSPRGHERLERRIGAWRHLARGQPGRRHFGFVLRISCRTACARLARLSAGGGGGACPGPLRLDVYHGLR